MKMFMINFFFMIMSYDVDPVQHLLLHQCKRLENIHVLLIAFYHFFSRHPDCLAISTIDGCMLGMNETNVGANSINAWEKKNSMVRVDALEWFIEGCST